MAFKSISRRVLQKGNKYMSTYINNLFNFGRALPEPFDALANKKVSIASKRPERAGISPPFRFFICVSKTEKENENARI